MGLLQARNGKTIFLTFKVLTLQPSWRANCLCERSLRPSAFRRQCCDTFRFTNRASRRPARTPWLPESFCGSSQPGNPRQSRAMVSQTRDFVHVTDVARANVAALDSDSRGLPINIGSGQAHSIKWLADFISPNQVYLPPRKIDLAATHADIRLAWDVLGWKPTISIRHGIGQTAMATCADVYLCAHHATDDQSLTSCTGWSPDNSCREVRESTPTALGAARRGVRGDGPVAARRTPRMRHSDELVQPAENGTALGSIQLGGHNTSR